MTVTAADVRAEVGTSSSDDQLITGILIGAQAQLDRYLDDALEAPPSEVYDQALLATAVEIFNQRKAPNGVLNQQYDLGDGTITSTPVRIAADPLRAAYPLLARWMPAAALGGTADTSVLVEQTVEPWVL